MTIMFDLASFSMVILENRYFKLCCLFGPSILQVILMKLQMLYERKSQPINHLNHQKNPIQDSTECFTLPRNNTKLSICYKLEIPIIEGRIPFIARKQVNIYSTKNSNMTLQQYSPSNRRIITLLSS